MSHSSPVASFGESWETYSNTPSMTTLKSIWQGRTGHPIRVSFLSLPVHNYFNTKAVDSELIIKGADGILRIDVRAANWILGSALDIWAIGGTPSQMDS